MIFKAIAHWWASSRLEEEEERTQSLIRKLDRRKKAAIECVQIKKSELSSTIKLHQEKRSAELEPLIDFMNGQLGKAEDYLPELHQFQSLMFTCLDSWMHVDLCQQEMDILSQKISAIFALIGLLDAYIFELNKLSQRTGRQAWSEFTAARELTVDSDFVVKAKARHDRASKPNRDEFGNEIRRLRSHREALYKQANGLCAERTDLLKSKMEVEQQHEANKQALAEKYDSCVGCWRQIARKFEVYYGFATSELDYVNEWISNLKTGGAPLEIKALIDLAHDRILVAKDIYKELEENRRYYASRITQAHNSQEYPDTFASDKTQRDSFKRKADAAWQDLQQQTKAKVYLYKRRDELRGYIDRIRPLHPQAAIDALCETLNAERKFNAWLLFGINTREQKREHWIKTQKRINAAAD